ncbi:MAG: hypothetical protein OXE99_12120 [Cellvibrionales bacterium]|nr:hypothetical protein [Cellvibrionales bacterium]
MAYTHIRYIAYHVGTVALKDGTHDTAIYQIPAGMTISAQEQRQIFQNFGNMDIVAGLVDKQKVLEDKPPIFSVKLLGDKDSVSTVRNDADVLARVQRFLTVLELAATTMASRDDLQTDGVLNVFSAPEFYFRPPNETVSYTEKMYRAIADVLSTTIKSCEALEDWLVLPGTIMWTQEVDQSKEYGFGKKFKVDQNTCLVIHGGLMGKTPTVEKLAPSNIDYVPSMRILQGDFPEELQDKDIPWIDRAEFLKRQGMWVTTRDHVVTIGGVRLGIEVCLDHGALKRYPRVTGDIPAQFIVACSKRILADKVCVTDGGFAARCDGFYGGGPRGEIRVITSYNPTDKSRWGKTTRGVLNPTNQFTNLGNANPHLELDIPIAATSPLYWPRPPEADANVWTGTRQAIKFYEPQAV